MSELIAKLKSRLECEALSLRQAAPNIGVSVSTLSRFLSGQEPSYRSVRAIERYLKKEIAQPCTCMWRETYLESLKVQHKLMERIKVLEGK